MKDLYSENYKQSMKEIEDTNIKIMFIQNVHTIQSNLQSECDSKVPKTLLTE